MVAFAVKNAALYGIEFLCDILNARHKPFAQRQRSKSAACGCWAECPDSVFLLYNL